MGAAVIGIVSYAVDDRVESKTGNRARVIEVVVLGKVASRAALITERGYPMVAEVVLGAERVVIRVSSGPGGWKRGEVHAAGGRQIGAGKGENGIRVRSIPVG